MSTLSTALLTRVSVLQVPRRALMHLATGPSGSYLPEPYMRLRSDYQTVTLPLAFHGA